MHLTAAARAGMVAADFGLQCKKSLFSRAISRKSRVADRVHRRSSGICIRFRQFSFDNRLSGT
jgi:hypothetical protein